MKQLFLSALSESFEIITIVFVLMIVIEIFVLKYKPVLIRLAQSNSTLAYLISTVFGMIPNCSTTFAMDSLYMSGYLSFGALIAVMTATLDDVGLLIFSKTVENKLPFSLMLIFFICLFVFAITGGWLADMAAKKLKWKFNVKCSIDKHEEGEFRLGHFIHEHIYEHILKKHIWKIFVWMFITLFIIGLFPDIFSESNFTGTNKLYLLIIAALVGILPSPAPNFFILNLFVLHPYSLFSVFMTNSIVQDGHGLLPILGYSYKDAIKVKAFKIVFGLIVGIAIYSLGF